MRYSDFSIKQLITKLHYQAIHSLHGFAICGESLNLEPKYARIVAYMLLDVASVVCL